MTIEIRVDPSIRAIPEASWDALDGIEDAPFLSWAWLDALETGCVGEGTAWAPHHLSFWEDGALIAAAPAYLKGNSEGEFVFDHGWAGAAARAGIPLLSKLLVAVPFTPANAHRLLVKDPADRPRLLPVLGEALRRLVHGEKLSSAHVLFLTEPEAKVLHGAGFCHRLGIQFHWQNRGYACFEDFLGRFSSKRRNQLRRERKDMSRQGISITTCGARYLRGHRRDVWLLCLDRGEVHLGPPLPEPGLLRRDVPRLPGKIEIILLAREGGRPIAGAFNLAGKRTLYGRYWGASEERPFLHFNVCFYHSIEECIARGLTKFEPGAGGSTRWCAASSRPSPTACITSRTRGWIARCGSTWSGRASAESRTRGWGRWPFDEPS